MFNSVSEVSRMVTDVTFGLDRARRVLGKYQSIMRQIKENDVDLVSFLFCDNAGVIRSKAVHVNHLIEKVNSGMSLSVVTQAATNTDALVEVDGMGAAGEVRLRPDVDSFVVTPYCPGGAAMLSDMVTVDHEPWGACPRTFLKRMMARAHAMGFSVVSAFEPEWYLCRQEGDDFKPIDRSLDNSTIGAMMAHGVVRDVVKALNAQRMKVEQYYPELGPGQQEVTVQYADALISADNHVLYRETVRNVAWRNHGLVASFAPKPFPDEAGSGCHIHLSLWDQHGIDNLFYDGEDDLNMSPLAYSFIAGVMEHLPALVAVTCPSVNSYRRLQPGWWSSAYACYGLDNREASIRIPSLFYGREQESANVELRACDSSSNPYLALGALLAAGLDGVERSLEVDRRQCVDCDPAVYDDPEQARRNIRPLPETLLGAVRNLENDRVLCEALGPLLLNSFTAVRREEHALFSRNSTAFELRHHVFKY